MDCRFGRSMHHTNIHYIISIPRITNELFQKLSEILPIVPIWMDCNESRFFNSKSPAKSLKLYCPISIDSNDSQFNMWNDFELSLPKLFFFWVNELFPILIVVNRFNPSILNVCTDPKESSPISIALTLLNREKSNIVYTTSLQVQSGKVIKTTVDSNDCI